MSKELKITKSAIQRLRDEMVSCPEAQEAIEKAFPEAFEDRGWENVTLLSVKLEVRGSDCTDAGAIGIQTDGEDFYMPYNVEFKDVWMGNRKSGNPVTKKYQYKLVNGRIYRKSLRRYS